MCQLCVHQDMKHLGSLESTQEARIVRGVNRKKNKLVAKYIYYLCPWSRYNTVTGILGFEMKPFCRSGETKFLGFSS